MKNVAFLRIEKGISVQKTVSEVMKLCRWNDSVRSDSFFLKVNLMSKEVVPGQCTSPWVFEGVLKEIRKKYSEAKIFFGDSDVATTAQLDKAVCNWGFIEIAKEYNAKFVNLSKIDTIKVSFGTIFKDIELPAILMQVDRIVSIPVIKTHCMTPFTGALKNQWGLLPRVRFKYHPVVDEAIAQINAFFRDKLFLGVADLTIAMEGPGPRVGSPKICNAIMASRDLVALDSVVAEYMGLDPNAVGFLCAAEANGGASSDWTIVGDDFKPNPFRAGKGKDYFVYRWRDRIKKVPLLGSFILGNTLPFRFFGYIAVFYYGFFWYQLYGRKYAMFVCQDNLYRQEFARLIWH